MARHLNLKTARNETSSARVRHLDLLDQVRAHCVSNNSTKDGFLYLLAIPIIYAAWEGYFKIACALCLKRRCIRGQKAKKYSSPYMTLWLQKEPFVHSYLQNLVNGMQLGKPLRKSGGQFFALANFAGNVANWLEGPIDHTILFDDLVMTHSNVNRDVAMLNGSVIGLNMGGVKFGRLDELLGRRNEIAHGGLLSFPTEAEVIGLISYTEDLIRSFDQSVSQWLAHS